jgi:hypothetical protein
LRLLILDLSLKVLLLLFLKLSPDLFLLLLNSGHLSSKSDNIITNVEGSGEVFLEYSSSEWLLEKSSFVADLEDDSLGIELIKFDIFLELFNIN